MSTRATLTRKVNIIVTCKPFDSKMSQKNFHRKYTCLPHMIGKHFCPAHCLVGIFENNEQLHPPFRT